MLHLYFCFIYFIRNRGFISRIFLRIRQQSSVIGLSVCTAMTASRLMSSTDRLQQPFSPPAMLLLAVVLKDFGCFFKGQNMYRAAELMLELLKLIWGNNNNIIITLLPWWFLTWLKRVMSVENRPESYWGETDKTIKRCEQEEVKTDPSPIMRRQQSLYTHTCTSVSCTGFSKWNFVNTESSKMTLKQHVCVNNEVANCARKHSKALTGPTVVPVVIDANIIKDPSLLPKLFLCSQK